ncbi:MAG: sugar-binding protein [Oscillospiraceae bacterium]|nr:sugar-binding protein [Oscillospiraceae bacterium]
MKKLTELFITLILMLFMLMSIVLSAAAETASVKTYNGTVVIDGIMDDEWKYAEEFTANEHDSNYWTASTDPKTASARFRTLWDENYIYIWCEITDPTVVTASRSSLWLTDCMIYHIDYANNKAGGFDAAKAGYIYVTAGKGLESVAKVFDGAIDAFKCSYKISAPGWIIEMAIPAKALDFTLTEGGKIGFEPQYNDSNDAGASGERVGLCTWNIKGAGGYADTSLYGTLVLSGISPEKPKEQPKEEPTDIENTNPATGDPFSALIILTLASLTASVVVKSKRNK